MPTGEAIAVVFWQHATIHIGTLHGDAEFKGPIPAIHAAPFFMFSDD
jgi:hypothetical protein